jgi:Putative Actinobacterial Holin-X, holin superfamily III
MASNPKPAGDQPVGELVHEITELVPRLVRQEVQLAKAELGEKGRTAGIGAGLFGGSGAIGFYGLGALVAAAILGLAEALPAWLAALIVAAAAIAVAGVLAMVGKKEIGKATPPVPEHAISGVKQDVTTVKESAQR